MYCKLNCKTYLVPPKISISTHHSDYSVMKFIMLGAVFLILLEPALASSSLASEAALTCFEGLIGSNETHVSNLTLALAEGRGSVVSGQMIGPLVEGANFGLACCVRRPKIRVVQLEWWHNSSSIESQKKHLIDDVAVTTIEVANVTMDGSALKFTCRDGSVRERSVILLLISHDEDAGNQGGQRAPTMVLIFFGMIFALPFFVIFLRAKKGAEIA